MNPQAVLDVCINEFLVPWEAYARKLSNGDCEAYPDPASPLVKMNRQERSRLSDEDYTRLGQPWTIGYGSTFDEFNVRVKPGDVWTHDKAVRVKAIVLRRFYNAMIAHTPHIVKEPIRRQAAVLSWIYNCGIRAYQISTFGRRVKSEDWEGAAEECLKWNKAQGKILRGLTRRRTAEADAIVKP